MTGMKPKVPTVASDLKKTRTAEAEARKRKSKNTTDEAPPTKKRKTKKKDRAAPTEPLVIEPISVARPASAHQERQLIVHEPASTEAPEAHEVPVVDPIVTEDIGPQDNVEDDEVLPQIQCHTVSSHVRTNNETISIGHPLMPISQDASWANRPQPATLVQDSPCTPRPSPPQGPSPIFNDDNYMETTPSPKASPVYQRLRKGQKPSVSMTTITEEDSHQSSPVARQVFPEDNPPVTVPASEANASEEIPAASAEERQEELLLLPVGVKTGGSRVGGPELCV